MPDEGGRTPSLEDTCPRGGEDLPCTCYQGPDFSEMTRPELEAAAERWRQRAIAAEAQVDWHRTTPTWEQM